MGSNMLFVFRPALQLLWGDILPCLESSEPLRAMQESQLIDTEMMAFLNHSSEAHLQQGIWNSFTEQALSNNFSKYSLPASYFS